MEDIVQALKIGFAMLVLVIALGISIFAINVANRTAKQITYLSNNRNFFDNMNISQSNNLRNRPVEIDTIISTLYRYKKENFAVKLYLQESSAKQPKLIQIFDVDIEGKMNTISAASGYLSKEDKEILEIYGKKGNDSTNPYLFGAPWAGTTLDITKRVDFYINGIKGYINDIEVDYTNNNLKRYNNDGYEFTESFVKYTYSGDTTSVGEGEEIETLTGSKQPEDKIEITYIIKKV